MTYLRMLGFYFLEFVGSGINFLCSIVKYYPALDLGVSFLLKMEGSKVMQQRQEQSDNRDKLEEEGNILKMQAYNDGKNI
jgi:hypothetical protein